MKKIKQLLLLLTTLVAVQSPAFTRNVPGMGEIRGLVKDENHDPAIGAVVTVTTGGAVAGKAVTDMDGKYVVKPLNPGYYDVLVQQTGYSTFTVKKVLVEAEDPSYVDVDIKPNELEGATITAEADWKKPKLDMSVYTMHKINATEINQMAVGKGDIVGIIANISSDVQVDENTNQIHSRGARAGTCQYFIDGERVGDNANFAALGIQNISIVTGGIPAQYGDLTGGAIIVTGKDYFTGLAEKRIRQNEINNRLAQLEKDKKEAEEKEKRKKEIEEEKKKEKEQQSKEN